jgi:Concanavalin A-like lectin/glucanases superfamily
MIIGPGITFGGGVVLSGPTVVSIVASGLQLYLDANDATSYPGTGTTWYDLSGNNNNLAMVNSSNISYTSSGGGYFTLASTGYFSSGTNTNMPSGSNPSYTVSAWVNVASVASYNGIMLIGSLTSLGAIGLTLQSPGSVTNFWYGYDASHTYTIPLNTWFNVTALWDGTTRYIYVNGSSLGTLTYGGSGTLNVTSSSVLVGASYPANTEYLQGKIGQALIYNRALTPTEITQNYTATRTRYGV